MKPKPTFTVPLTYQNWQRGAGQARRDPSSPLDIESASLDGGQSRHSPRSSRVCGSRRSFPTFERSRGRLACRVQPSTTDSRARRRAPSRRRQPRRRGAPARVPPAPPVSARICAPRIQGASQSRSRWVVGWRSRHSGFRTRRATRLLCRLPPGCRVITSPRAPYGSQLCRPAGAPARRRSDVRVLVCVLAIGAPHPRILPLPSGQAGSARGHIASSRKPSWRRRPCRRLPPFAARRRQPAAAKIPDALDQSREYS